jgi:hypothetical protein
MISRGDDLQRPQLVLDGEIAQDDRLFVGAPNGWRQDDDVIGCNACAFQFLNLTLDKQWVALLLARPAALLVVIRQNNLRRTPCMKQLRGQVRALHISRRAA